MGFELDTEAFSEASSLALCCSMSLCAAVFSEWAGKSFAKVSTRAREASRNRQGFLYDLHAREEAAWRKIGASSFASAHARARGSSSAAAALALRTQNPLRCLDPVLLAQLVGAMLTL